MGDLMIHIDEELDSASLMDIEDVMNHTDGVSDCHIAKNDPHMMAQRSHRRLYCTRLQTEICMRSWSVSNLSNRLQFRILNPERVAGSLTNHHLVQGVHHVASSLFSSTR